MVQHKQTVVGNRRRILGKKEKVCEPYIPRCLSQNLIDIAYLNSIDHDTLIVLDCMNKLDLIKEKIGNFNQHKVDIYLNPDQNNNEDEANFIKIFVSGPDMFVSENFCSEEKFNQVCGKDEKNREKNFHHLRIVDESTLEWIRSTKTVQDLNKFRLTRDFIPERKFYKKIEGSKSEDVNRTNVVIADAGMGKSELMKNIKNHLNSNLRTVFMQREDMNELCKRKVTVDEVKNFLEKKICSASDLREQIVDSLIEHNQVVYFWDGLDEIDNVDKITDFIGKLEKSIHWITARRLLKEKLEEKFHVLARTIREFDEEERTIYIHTRLQERSEEDIEKICAKINEIALSQSNGVLEVPLQIHMLTELFQQNFRDYKSLLEQNSDSFLVELFDKTIDKKLMRFYLKQDKNLQNLELEKKKRNYKQAALESLLPPKLLQPYFLSKGQIEDCNVGKLSKLLEPKCNEYKSFLEKIESKPNKNDDIGIALITTVINGVPQFCHRSYAEFLAAKYLFEDVREEFEAMKKKVDFNYTNILFYYDILNTKSPIDKAVIFKSIDSLKKHQEKLQEYDENQIKNVLQLACSYGKKIPLLGVERSEDGFVINIENDDMFTAEDPNYTKLFQYLLDNCHISELRDQFKLYQYATERHWLIASLKLSMEFNYKLNNLEFKRFLYYSTKFGYHQYLELFDENNIPVVRVRSGQNEKSLRSLLHVAVDYNQEECLEKLLAIDSYKELIEEPDEHGETLLFKACKSGLLSITQMLLKAGAKITARSKDDTTPLHTACLHRQIKIVKLLIKKDDKIINDKTKLGVTPLHLAAWNGHVEVVKLLLDNGADINVQTEDGCTPLFVASRNDHISVVKELRKHGADLNLPRKDGLTPRMIADQEKHKNIANLLKFYETK